MVSLKKFFVGTFVSFLVKATVPDVIENRVLYVDFGTNQLNNEITMLTLNPECLYNLNTTTEYNLKLQSAHNFSHRTNGKNMSKKSSAVQSIIETINYKLSEHSGIYSRKLMSYLETPIVEYEFLENVDVLLIKSKSKVENKIKLLQILESVPCNLDSPRFDRYRPREIDPKIDFDVFKKYNEYYNKWDPKYQRKEEYIEIIESHFNELSGIKMFKRPNDPQFYDQWHLFGPDQLEKYGTDVVSTWEAILNHLSQIYDQPAAAFFEYGLNLEPIEVALVDSGCSMHNDLIERLAYIEHCTFGQKTYFDPVTQKIKGCFGHHFGDNLPDPTNDTANHGTPAAGIVAAKSNNNIGISGICPSCKVVCLNIVNSKNGKIATSSIIKAIDYIIERKIKVSNHSYGGFGSDMTEQRAFQKLHKTNNHLAFTASGNAGCNIGCNNYNYCPRKCLTKSHWTPAEFHIDSLITVGSTDREGNVSMFSNVGDQTVDLFAPGNNIVSLSNLSPNKLVVVSGTSFSSPIAAAIAALLWSSIPTATPAQVKKALLLGAIRYDHLRCKFIIAKIILRLFHHSRYYKRIEFV